MKKETNFDRIIPTAWMTAYRRTFTDIPYSLDIFAKLEEIKEREGIEVLPAELRKPELAPQFEARHKLIDKLINQQGASQILELAAGFSSRGLILSRASHVSYVELDLPAVIREKERIVREVAQASRFAVPRDLHFIAGNALEASSFSRAAEHFDKRRKLTIVNEGLLRYLTRAEKARVARNIHQLLEVFSGTWITSDISLRQIFRSDNKEMSKYVQKVSALTGVNIFANRFETEEEARDFFESLGFSIERHSFMEVFDDLVSPKNLKLSAQQTRDVLAGAVVYVMRAV